MKTIYIDIPPDSVDCIYCGQTCPKTEPHEVINEYFCYNHGDMEIMFRCAQHKIIGPNWFFNVIKVTRGQWRLSWNFYSGPWAWLEKLIPAEERKWGEHWKPVSTKIPATFLSSSISMISSYLNLYRVFS